MNSTKSTWIAIAIVAVIAIIGVFTPKVAYHLGAASTATTNLPSLGLNGPLQVGTGCGDGYSTCTAGTTLSATTLTQGTSGVAITNLAPGTCYIKAYATTIAASSTAVVDCQGTALIDQSTGRIGAALTGVSTNDKVVVTLSTTTSGTVSNGLVVTGANGSTTAGYIQLTISNLTGAVFTWPTTNFAPATGTASFIDWR